MYTKDSKERNKILLVLFFGVLMGALDIAIVGPALPAIQKQFNIDERSVAWIFAVYVLFNLVGTPLMAKLSDTIDRRKIYIIDVFLFAVGSLIVAVSTNFSILIIGRSIQGFGAGGIFPVASAVIGDTFPEEKRGSALGLIGAVFGIAFIIGPALAGVLLLLSWHWLFIINIPIAIVIIFLTMKYIPKSAGKSGSKFDWSGTLLISIILAFLAFSFNQINSSEFIKSITSWEVLPFLIISIALIPIFIKNENKSFDPLLRMKLLASRQVSLVCILAIGAGITEAAVVFVPPLLVSSFHVTTSQASFMLIPIVLTMAVGSPSAGRMLDKLGSKVVLIIGSTLLTGGMFGLAYASGTLSGFYISASLIGLGSGFLIGAPLRYIMLNESKKSERASAQGALRLFTGVGQLLGGVIVGALASSLGGGLTGLQFAYLAVGIFSAFLIVVSFGLKGRKEELKVIKESLE